MITLSLHLVVPLLLTLVVGVYVLYVWQVSKRQDRVRICLAVEADPAVSVSVSVSWDAKRAVTLTSVEDWAAAKDFPRFARAILDSAASCSGRVALTRVGKARLEQTSKLTLFRLAVYGQKWTEAKHLADELRQVSASLV